MADNRASFNLNYELEIATYLKASQKILHYKEINEYIFSRYHSIQNASSNIKKSNECIPVLPGFYAHKSLITDEFHQKLISEKKQINQFIREELFLKAEILFEVLALNLSDKKIITIFSKNGIKYFIANAANLDDDLKKACYSSQKKFTLNHTVNRNAIVTGAMILKNRSHTQEYTNQEPPSATEQYLTNKKIWNASIKRSFQTWMESKDYASAVKSYYCSAVNRTVQNYKPLADVAGSEFSTTPEAVRKFVTLLCENSDFIAANRTAHNLLSAALKAFARFIDSDTLIDNATVSLSKKVNDDSNSMVVKVLYEHFPNGFRLDSPIELLRFHRFTKKDFGEKIALPDEELKQFISVCGIYFDGKVYVVSLETQERIKNEIDYAFNGGMEIIFYEAFYQKHEDWLFPASVISFEMLKCVLLKFYPNYKHRGNYFTNNSDGGTEIIKIKDEIVRVWGDDILLDYEQLAERLPYIPFEKIKHVLAYHAYFIWNSEEVYTHVNMIQISEEERSQIMEFALKWCRAEGFVSLSEIPLDEIQERNFELTLAAIHHAVFRVCLEGNFDRKGKIITYKGDKLDALAIMKNYCRIVDKCSLDDLLNYEKELTGEIHRWIPMEAGYAILVRTGKNTYVSEKYVNFNIEMIDNAISLFVTDDYLPLKSFTTFAAFPHCGQAWNLFLLESYCRRFSDRFRFEVLAVNSKNAGAVVRKNCRLSYTEIMVDAVAKSSIALEKTAVEDFLCSTGYTGRRSYAKVNELIEQAKVMRERMD